MDGDNPKGKLPGPRVQLARSRATAFHEAGHAVVGFLVGNPATGSTIQPNGDDLGSTSHGSWEVSLEDDAEPTPERERQIHVWIDTLLAGVIAERRATGRRHNWTGAASDLSTATALAIELNGSSRQVELYLAWRRECSRGQVEGSWPAIERVAQALLRRITLDGDEIRQIILARPSKGDEA